MRNLILAGALFFATTQVANAALFDDKEARKQITDLQQQVQTQDQATQAALADIKKNQQALEQRLVAIEAIVKGQGLVDLLSQIDRLNQELSKVKGQLEVASHNIELSQQRQKDLYVDLDGRLRKVESGGTPAADNASSNTVATENKDAPANAESKDFESAMALSNAGKFKEAFDALDKFLQTYPNSINAPDAQYALGLSQFSLKNYKAAMATQQKMIKQFPEHAKVPDATFNIANCQIQLADIDGAKKTLRGLVDTYPNSSVIPNAKRRLTVLDSIKK